MVDINTKSTIDTKESVDVPLVPGDESKFPAHQTVLASSNSNLTTNQDETFPCDKCEKPLPNDLKAKLLHMSRAHNDNSIQCTPGPPKLNQTPNQGFDCESCAFTCQSKPSLKRHVAMMHSNSLKGNVRSDGKRKLPEKREKCDICGRMLLNAKGLDIHKKRMHPTENRKSNKQFLRSDSVGSVKSVQSVTSPPPKKHEKDPNPKKVTLEVDAKPEEMDTEQAKINSIKLMEIEEDLRLSRLDVVTLKRESELLRHVNKTQTENHAKTVKHIEDEHLRAIKVFGDEHNKALNEISKLQNDVKLLKAREEVIAAVTNILEEDGKEQEEDECIMDIKCKGDCRHIMEEDLKNLKNMRNIKQKGGNPICPYCSVSFTNVQVLNKHIDDNHPDNTVHTVHPTNTKPTSTPATRPPTTVADTTGTPTTDVSAPQASTANEEVNTPQEELEEGEDNSGDLNPEDQEETGDLEEDWNQVERQGGRFRCNVCGYTRNTKYQLDKHMQERHEGSEEGLHENSVDSQITCDLCNKYFRTKRERSNHMSSDHKSYKPCDYFKEGKCDVDGECRYNHTILKAGQEICYKCGQMFNSKRDMLKHINIAHGQETCHRFLRNECTVRRCLFSHNILTASNEQRGTHEGAAPHPTSADFHSLPTARPVVWSRAVAQGPKTPVMPKTFEEQVLQTLTQMMPQITQQLVTALRTGMTTN